MAVLFLLGVGFVSRNEPIAEVVDKKANERWATQSVIEAGEVSQMVQSANEYRRKRGLPEVTEADFRAMAAEEQRRAIKQAKKQRRSRH
jgi:acetyl-CoA acetyltransferase